MTEPRAAGGPPQPTRDDRHLETPYRVAFERGLEAIAIAQDGVVRVVNPAACRLSGYAEEELVGRSFLDLVHPEDRPGVQERYQRRLAGDTTERSTIMRVVRKDGDLLWLESHSMPLEWQGRPAVLIFFADVTERELSIQEAHEQERMFQRVAELSPQFIFIYDYDEGRDIYINRSVPGALGYTPEQEIELQPYPFARLCHPEDLARAMDREERWRDVPEGSADVAEFRLRAASGEWRWFRSLNTPFRRDRSGRVTQILGVSEDVTDRRRTEEALRRSEKLASLAVLAGGLAHDFGNLLTPVLGHAELMLEKLPPDSPLGAHATAIRSAAEHAAELVEQLLVYAGGRPTERRAVELNALVEEAAELHGAVLPSRVRIDLDLDPGLPAIDGDPSQLRQVVLNLLINGLEALDERGGAVVLRTARAELDATTSGHLHFSSGIRPGPVALLEVADTGSGMDAATRSRLLEPFFTTKPRGRGLGLASTLGILRRHGAGLDVVSRRGEGTVFRVFLPLEAPGGGTNAD